MDEIDNDEMEIMPPIDPQNIIGGNYFYLLELQPPAIVLYCFLASIDVDYRPKQSCGEKISGICFSKEYAENLPLTIDQVFLGLYELIDVDLVTLQKIDNNCFYLRVNAIYGSLVSNGFIEDFYDFIKNKN